MQQRSWLLFFLCLLTGLVPPTLRADSRLETVALQLNWTHAFQFAGYYAALEKGFYREAGLNVLLYEGYPGIDTANVVLRGEAQYGVGSTGLMFLRNQGQPVVVLGVVFQHSPRVILARKTGEAQGIHDLVGKRLMLEPQIDELTAYLNKEGLKGKVTLVEHSLDLRLLLDGTVDAMAAFLYDQPRQLNTLGFAYDLFSPLSVGIDFYGDNLFTIEAEINKHPRRAEAFCAASMRGWQYAMDHPEEIVNLILAKYPSKQNRDELLNEARHMMALMQLDVIEAGYMNPSRWRHILDIYAELGMLPKDFDLDGFLYQPATPVQYRLLIKWGAGGLLVFILAGWLIVHFSRIARQARESEERHRLLADHVTDVIWVADIHGRYTYISPSVERLRGYTPEEAMRLTMDEEFTAQSVLVAQREFEKLSTAAQANQELPLFRGELEICCKNGGTVWTEASCSPLFDADRKFIGVVGVTRDISDRKRMEEELRKLATTDPLTGAYNRRFLYDRAAHELERGRRFSEPLSFLLLDIDWFKRINDAHGHDVGDEVLKAMSAACMGMVRSIDLFCRLGGEEFGILLVNTTLQGGRAFAERLRGYLATLRVDSRTGPVQFTVSIGLSETGEKECSVHDLIKQADLALYIAKANGRNRVETASACRYPQEADTQVGELLRLIWDDLMCCGQTTIDTQHRRLFALANTLLDAEWDVSGQPPDTTPVQAFLDEAAAHFRDEEALLRAAGYAEVEQHAGMHRVLLTQANDLLAQFKARSLPPGALFRFIVQDLMHDHMLCDDAKFYPLFAETDSAKQQER